MDRSPAVRTNPESAQSVLAASLTKARQVSLNASSIVDSGDSVLSKQLPELRQRKGIQLEINEAQACSQAGQTAPLKPPFSDSVGTRTSRPTRPEGNPYLIPNQPQVSAIRVSPRVFTFSRSSSTRRSMGHCGILRAKVETLKAGLHGRTIRGMPTNTARLCYTYRLMTSSPTAIADEFRFE